MYCIAYCRDKVVSLQGLSCRNRSSLSAITLSSQHWHCHNTRTSQPKRLSSARFFLSLLRFSWNFVVQNSLLVFGNDLPWRQLCLCQKQPLTKTTFRKRRKTRSGVPGNSLTCKRYRYPRLCAIFRTAYSGRVSFALMRLISALRFSGLIMSTRHLSLG